MNNNGLNKFFTKVFIWMFIGLLLSGVTAYITVSNLSIFIFVYKAFYLWILLELGLVIAINALRNKVSPTVAKILFAAYSIVSGLTFSSIFITFEIGSIFLAFLSTAIMFVMLALYGNFTKQDLSSFGKIMLIGLLSILVVSIINIFIGSSTLDVIISIVSILIFLGLIAFDTQKLKRIYNYYSNDNNMLEKASIYGALDLYLDFVNIFLDLLNLFGKRKK